MDPGIFISDTVPLLESRDCHMPADIGATRSDSNACITAEYMYNQVRLEFIAQTNHTLYVTHYKTGVHNCGRGLSEESTCIFDDVIASKYMRGLLRDGHELGYEIDAW